LRGAGGCAGAELPELDGAAVGVLEPGPDAAAIATPVPPATTTAAGTADYGDTRTASELQVPYGLISFHGNVLLSRDFPHRPEGQLNPPDSSESLQEHSARSIRDE
jgi:hypothetical protein